MKILYSLIAGSLLAYSTASASIYINTVFVGDAGNAPSATTGFGGVSYDYHIGTHEVTNAQYAAFLNAVAKSDPHGLWNENMGTNAVGGISRSGSAGDYSYSVRTGTEGINNGQSMANRPVNFVNFWSAARFTNWLTTGNTEIGVYNLLGVTSPTNNAILRDPIAWLNGGVAIASENEWFKAAYYDPTLNSGSGDYWLYPTQSNLVPNALAPNNTDSNSANRTGSLSPDPFAVTPVGGYELASSYYGTFDQGGNVWEWNDAIIDDTDRGLRGGSFASADTSFLSSSYSTNFDPLGAGADIGFRVTSLAPIPEPSSFTILGGIGLCLALRRRREWCPSSKF